MRIRFKLVLLGLLLIVVGLSLSGSTYYFVTRQAIEERVNAQLESVSILKRNQFDAFMDRIVNDVEDIAEHEITTHYFVSNPENAAHEIHVENLERFLKEQLQYTTDFFEFSFIDLSGMVIASTDEDQIGKYKSSEPYFNKGKEGAYIQYFYYDVSLQDSAITVSTPVHDPSGELRGVFTARLDLARISDFMTERSGLGQTGETYLVNKFSFVVTELRAEEKATLRKLIQTKGIKNCLKGESGFDIYESYQKVPVIGYYVWIPESEICLVTEISQTEALAPVRQVVTFILLISFGVLVLAMALAFFLSKTITNPISKLKDAAVRIGKGNLDTKIDIRSKDEIGDLASEFSKMTKELQQSQARLEAYGKELEKKVQERTEDLEGKNRELEKFNKVMIDRELKMIELKKQVQELKKQLGIHKEEKDSSDEPKES